MLFRSPRPQPRLYLQMCAFEERPHVCGLHHNPRYCNGPKSPRTASYADHYLAGVVPPPSLLRLRPDAPEFVPSSRAQVEMPSLASTESTQALGFTLGVPDYNLWSEPTYPDFSFIADCWMTTTLLDC